MEQVHITIFFIVSMGLLAILTEGMALRETTMSTAQTPMWSSDDLYSNTAELRMAGAARTWPFGGQQTYSTSISPWTSTYSMRTFSRPSAPHTSADYSDGDDTDPSHIGTGTAEGVGESAGDEAIRAVTDKLAFKIGVGAAGFLCAVLIGVLATGCKVLSVFH